MPAENQDTTPAPRDDAPSPENSSPENPSPENPSPSNASPQNPLLPDPSNDSDGSLVHGRIDAGLTRVQHLAMQRLVAGSSIAQAARAAQVDRRTVYRWIEADARFAAAYNAWQRETVASGRARVLAMNDVALDTVQNAVLKGDLRAAIHVAKANGSLDAPKPGTTDPAWFDHRQKLRDHARGKALSSAEFFENQKRQRDPARGVADWENFLDVDIRRLREALRTEPPEARAARLADQGKRHIDYDPMTVRLLKTMETDHPPAKPPVQPPLLGRWTRAGSLPGDPELLTWRERMVLEQLRRKMLGEPVQVEEVTLAPWEVEAINEAREKLLDEGFIPEPEGRVVPGPRDSWGRKPIGTREQLESRAVPPRPLPAPSPAAPPSPTDPAASAPAPPPAAPTATAGPNAPPASPVPRAEPAAFQGARAVSAKSVATAPPRHRPPPMMGVAYDGSDEMDNEPGWVKII